MKIANIEDLKFEPSTLCPHKVRANFGAAQNSPERLEFHGPTGFHVCSVEGLKYVSCSISVLND